MVFDTPQNPWQADKVSSLNIGVFDLKYYGCTLRTNYANTLLTFSNAQIVLLDMYDTPEGTRTGAVINNPGSANVSLQSSKIFINKQATSDIQHVIEFSIETDSPTVSGYFEFRVAGGIGATLAIGKQDAHGNFETSVAPSEERVYFSMELDPSWAIEAKQE
jgi:hypothetical protein